MASLAILSSGLSIITRCVSCKPRARIYERMWRLMAKSRNYVVNVGNKLEHGEADGTRRIYREGESVPSDLTDEQLLSLRQAMTVVPQEVFDAQKGATEAQRKAEAAKAEADAEAAQAFGQARDDAQLAEREALVESLEAG